MSFVDVHATVAELAGADLPSADLDSLSFAGVWRGETSAVRRQELVCFQEPIAIRWKSWKLIDHPGSAGFLSHRPETPFLNRAGDELNPAADVTDVPRGQLYELTADPSEKNNLWNANPEVVQRLSARLAELASP
jgi:hypothetical protein